VCGGLGCPPKEIVRRYTPPPPPPDPNTRDERNKEHDKGQEPIVPLPTRELLCFCLDAYATGGVRVAKYYGKPYLEPFLDAIEIVDIRPGGLEANVECYLRLLLQLSVLPRLRILLGSITLHLTEGVPDLFLPTNIAVSAVHPSPEVPNNPAIEDELLKVFIHAEVI
jgi:hypothetical protein